MSSDHFIFIHVFMIFQLLLSMYQLYDIVLKDVVIV